MIQIIYPVSLLALWTLAISVYVLYARVNSSMTGKINPVYFRLFQGYEAPDSVIKSTRQWANLFEAPVLFYVVCILIIITNTSNVWFARLAWCYVVARIVHSIIHITYNKVMHRLSAFMVSQLALLIMWILLIFEIQAL